MSVDPVAQLISGDNGLLAAFEEYKKEPETSDEARLKIRSLALQLLDATETPTETVQRYIYQPHQNAVIKVAADLGIFKLLDNRQIPVHYIEEKDIALEVKADKDLIIRIMRVLAASGLVNEIAPGYYIKNAQTSAMASETGDSGIKCLYELAAPTAVKLHEFFEDKGYVNPKNEDECPMRWTVGTNQFRWMSRPENHETRDAFNTYMGARRKGKIPWHVFYPVTKHLIEGFNRNYSETWLVDVGGNKGQEVMELLSNFRRIPGFVAVQDLEGVVPKSLVGITTQAYNFFEGQQPIKDARVYLFRSIFHDWSDSCCRTILENTVKSMKPGYSKMIIVDFVLPSKGASLFSSLLDIQMMCLSAGAERTMQMWRGLLGPVGLKVMGVWHSKDETEAVIEAMVPDPEELLAMAQGTLG